jgi:hypothetical protein
MYNDKAAAQNDVRLELVHLELVYPQRWGVGSQHAPVFMAQDEVPLVERVVYSAAETTAQVPGTETNFLGSRDHALVWHPVM